MITPSLADNSNFLLAFSLRGTNLVTPIPTVKQLPLGKNKARVCHPLSLCMNEHSSAQEVSGLRLLPLRASQQSYHPALCTSSPRTLRTFSPLSPSHSATTSQVSPNLSVTAVASSGSSPSYPGRHSLLPPPRFGPWPRWIVTSHRCFPPSITWSYSPICCNSRGAAVFSVTDLTCLVNTALCFYD